MSACFQPLQDNGRPEAVSTLLTHDTLLGVWVGRGEGDWVRERGLEKDNLSIKMLVEGRGGGAF